MTTYVLAGGCFWCLDAVYRKLKGVEISLTGYTGGTANDADYYRVASGRTSHAESVQVSFDETVIPKETILNIFFLIHDPTSLNKQGADEGPQYASVMFYENNVQKSEFESALHRAQDIWDKPIVTRIEPLEDFYEAESEHQDYFENNPGNGYCSVVIAPKVTKARKEYAEWFK